MYFDLKEKLDKFYDLEEHESDALISEINQRARKNIQGFIGYMNTLEFGNESTRTLFYEAIWTTPKGFDAFLIAEIELLVQQAEAQNEGAIEDMDSLFYLLPKEDMAPVFYEKAFFLLEEKVLSKVPEVRQYVAEVLLDLQYEGIFDLNPSILQKIERLLYDADFEVRTSVYISMEEVGLLPADFKLSLMDKVRMKVLG